MLIEVQSRAGRDQERRGDRRTPGAGGKDCGAAASWILPGLMCIPPFLEEPEKVRPYFRRLRELRDDLDETLGRQLPVLSMGMSHDFEVAIEEGATEVRVGTALFGTRRFRRSQ